jgi:hypothetical protein
MCGASLLPLDEGEAWQWGNNCKGQCLTPTFSIHIGIGREHCAILVRPCRIMLANGMSLTTSTFGF